MNSRKILSIQSQVASGYVGGNIANLIIQLHGIDVISIPTVLFSTHADNSSSIGDIVDEHIFSELLLGVESINVKNDISYIITGYNKDVSLIDITYKHVKRLIETVGSKYICDPVMGDYRTGGLYVETNIAEQIISKLIPIAHIITPNHFELEYILGDTFCSPEELLALIKKQQIFTDKIIIATSVRFRDTPICKKEIAIIDKNNIFRISYTEIDISIVGTGDLFTAILSAQLTNGYSIIESVNIAVSFISELLAQMYGDNMKELSSKSIIKLLKLINKEFK